MSPGVMRPGRTVIFAWTVIAWSGPWRIAKSKRLKDFAIAAERAISATVTPPTSKNWQADRGVREGNARCVPRGRTAGRGAECSTFLGLLERVGLNAANGLTEYPAKLADRRTFRRRRAVRGEIPFQKNEMSLSGLEEIANIREILESLLGSNAECNAPLAEILAVVEAWPALAPAARAKILELVKPSR